MKNKTVIQILAAMSWIQAMTGFYMLMNTNLKNFQDTILLSRIFEDGDVFTDIVLYSLISGAFAAFIMWTTLRESSYKLLSFVMYLVVIIVGWGAIIIRHKVVIMAMYDTAVIINMVQGFSTAFSLMVLPSIKVDPNPNSTTILDKED